MGEEKKKKKQELISVWLKMKESIIEKITNEKPRMICSPIYKVTLFKATEKTKAQTK